MEWLRKQIRAWRRTRIATQLPPSFPPALPSLCGTAHVALCAEDGGLRTPVFRSVLIPGLTYNDAWDTEIRGFLDGAVKLRRNVATQYHVRIGCEASKPDRGRYEVLRVLQRWGLSRIPRRAQVHDATLRLAQEDITAFPHRQPLVWPVDIHLHAVSKPWGPGRGGTGQDNQSEPEAGDAWWLDAARGELAWRIPGCGFASDTDAEADRGAELLAAARLESSADDLVFSGTRLTGHVQRQLAAGLPLNLLLKASDALEARPGSVRAFYSREFGDDLAPRRRPRLEVRWSAAAAYVESRDFVLEPGTSLRWQPGVPADLAGPHDVAAFVETALPCGDPAPEVTAKAPATYAPGGVPLAVELAAQGLAVRAGETLGISLLETWTPDVRNARDLDVRVEFTSPCGRRIESRARHVPPFNFVAELKPDELGLWRYGWRSLPDRRFPAHTGGGYFSVVQDEADLRHTALREMAAAALSDVPGARGLLARRRLHCRLALLVPALRAAALDDVLERVLAAMAALD